MPDDKLGKYEIRGQLGKGAMGTVYDGWDPILERRVAIKTVRLPSGSDVEAQDDLARFRREAQAAGRLTHANIVGTYDYGETSDVAYIVMEFVDGRTLKDLLDRKEVMPLPVLARVMDDLLAGLQYSHDRGVVHRDIKPANIMLTKEGQAKIADFGIARIENSSMTQAGTVLGTPAYMSPEQFMGNVVDLRTDIYSSGVVLYQLLTGERPFEGSMTAIMHKVLNVPPPKPSDLSVTCPPGFDPVVARAMAKRPDDRFASATAFAEAIRSAQSAPVAPAGDPLAGPDPLFDEGTVVMAPPRTAAAAPAAQSAPHDPTVMVRREDKKRGGLALPLGIAAAVVLAALGGGGYFLFSGGATKTGPVGGSGPEVIVASNDAPKAPAAAAAAPPGNALPPIVNVPQVNPPVGTGNTNPPPIAAANPVTSTVGPAMTGAPPIANANPVAPPARPANTPPPIANANPVNVAVGAANTPPPPIASVNPVRPPSNANPPPVASTNPINPPSGNPPTASPPSGTPPIGVPPPVASLNPVNSSANPPAVIPPPVQTADPTAPTVTATVTRSLADIRADVDAAVKATRCAVLGDAVGGTSASPSIGVDGAASASEAAGLRARLEPIAAGQQVQWNVREIDTVYCRALDIVRPFATVGRPGGVSVGLDKKVLVKDDFVTPRVTVPDWPAHLQIAYLAHDKSVFYITPSKIYPDTTYAARSTHVFGDRRAGFTGWQVGEPYGTDIIIAIASSAELMPPRPAALSPDDGEADSGPYLNDLQAAIERADKRQGNRLSATVLLVDTVETLTKP